MYLVSVGMRSHNGSPFHWDFTEPTYDHWQAVHNAIRTFLSGLTIAEKEAEEFPSNAGRFNVRHSACFGRLITPKTRQIESNVPVPMAFAELLAAGRGFVYAYCHTANGNSYVLQAKLEDASNSALVNSLAAPPAGCTNTVGTVTCDKSKGEYCVSP